MSFCAIFRKVWATTENAMKKLFLFGCVLTCTNLFLKRYALQSTRKQLTKKSRLVALLFLERTLHDPLPPLHDHLSSFHVPALALLSLLLLWALSMTTFSLALYYPNEPQVLPPSALHTTTPRGLRYYHLQPYTLLPPLGFRYYHLQPYNPFSPLFLPAVYVGGVKMSLKCGTVYFVRRAVHCHFICSWALSFQIECPVFQLKCVLSGIGKIKHLQFDHIYVANNVDCSLRRSQVDNQTSPSKTLDRSVETLGLES